MTSSIFQMFETEGFINAMKVIHKMITDANIRERMMNAQNTFGKYNDYLGYGVFGFRK